MTGGSRFAARCVLVTGSTGMAASAAKGIAAEGGLVAIVSRNAEHAGALAAEIGEAGGHATWQAADLRHEDAVDSVFHAIRDQLPRLDAVYSVAGISGRRFGDGPLHEATTEGWDTVMAVNARSQFLVARAAVRWMLGQEVDADGLRGSILLMSSVLAEHPAPEYFSTHAYAASKGAIDALARAAAASYAPHRIRVNAVAPGLVTTPMSRRAQDDPAILAYLARRQPLTGGPIDVDAVTEVALHLLSGESRAVTGQVIAVDAGWGVSDPG